MNHLENQPSGGDFQKENSAADAFFHPILICDSEGTVLYKNHSAVHRIPHPRRSASLRPYLTGENFSVWEAALRHGKAGFFTLPAPEGADTGWNRMLLCTTAPLDKTVPERYAALLIGLTASTQFSPATADTPAFQTLAKQLAALVLEDSSREKSGAASSSEAILALDARLYTLCFGAKEKLSRRSIKNTVRLLNEMLKEYGALTGGLLSENTAKISLEVQHPGAAFLSNANSYLAMLLFLLRYGAELGEGQPLFQLFYQQIQGEVVLCADLILDLSEKSAREWRNRISLEADDPVTEALCQKREFLLLREACRCTDRLFLARLLSGKSGSQLLLRLISPVDRTVLEFNAVDVSILAERITFLAFLQS